MGKLGKIIRMEFRLTVANKVFLAMTILGPFLIAAVTLMPGLLATGGALGGPVTRVALFGADPRFVEEIAPSLSRLGIDLSAVNGTLESVQSQVLSGRYDGYLALPADFSSGAPLEYVSRDSADFRVMGALEGVIGSAVVVQRLLKAGVPLSRTSSLTQAPAFTMRRLGPGGMLERSSDFATVLLTGLMFATLLYVTILLYGQVIGRSVLTEKTSRTAEIMLSSVRPMDLLFGKILGKALASLLQYAVWVSVSLGVVRLAGPGLGVSIGGGLSPGTLAFLVLFFVLAFFLYCSLYAALGAASEDEQHFGQLAWPVVIFLLIPLVLISPIIATPRAPVIIGLSLFPLTAPIVMFLRILVGAARPWEILTSVGLILAATAAVIFLSAKIFRVGILMTGKRFSFREVLRTARSP